MTATNPARRRAVSWIAPAVFAAGLAAAAPGAAAGGAVTLPPAHMVPAHIPAHIAIVRAPYWEIHRRCLGRNPRRDFYGGGEGRAAECALGNAVIIPAAGSGGFQPAEICGLMLHGLAHALYRWDHNSGYRYLVGLAAPRFPGAVPAICGELVEFGGRR